MKGDYQKALKKLTLFFLTNPVAFNRQIYQKQKMLGTSEHLVFSLQNKFRKIPLMCMCYLTKFYDLIRNTKKWIWKDNKSSFLDEIKIIFYSFWRAMTKLIDLAQGNWKNSWVHFSPLFSSRVEQEMFEIFSYFTSLIFK